MGLAFRTRRLGHQTGRTDRDRSGPSRCRSGSCSPDRDFDKQTISDKPAGFLVADSEL
jgi:hypothetical protein